MVTTFIQNQKKKPYTVLHFINLKLLSNTVIWNIIFVFQKYLDKNKKVWKSRVQVLYFGNWTRRRLWFRKVYVPGVRPFIPTVSVDRVDRAPFAWSYNETICNGEAGNLKIRVCPLIFFNTNICHRVITWPLCVSWKMSLPSLETRGWTVTCVWWKWTKMCIGKICIVVAAYYT